MSKRSVGYYHCDVSIGKDVEAVIWMGFDVYNKGSNPEIFR